MRKPILAGVLGALGAIAVIAGLLAFQSWRSNETASPQDSPGEVSVSEASPSGREDGTVSPAPEDILDVSLSVGDSVISEVTRNGVDGGAAEALDTGESPTATGTTGSLESTGARPRSGPAEVPTIQEHVDFVVRDADGKIKQSGSSR